MTLWGAPANVGQNKGLRLKDLLGPVTRVKKKKDKGGCYLHLPPLHLPPLHRGTLRDESPASIQALPTNLTRSAPAAERCAHTIHPPTSTTKASGHTTPCKVTPAILHGVSGTAQRAQLSRDAPSKQDPVQCTLSLVFKAHRLVYHWTLGLRVIKNREAIYLVSGHAAPEHRQPGALTRHGARTLRRVQTRTRSHTLAGEPLHPPAGSRGGTTAP